MKLRILLSAITLLVALSASAGAQGLEATQTYDFPFSPGDSVIVQNDYGRIQVESAPTDHVEVSIRRMATSQEGMQNVSVVCQKAGTRIYVQAYFYRYSAESVFVHIRAPRGLDVLASGANPSVDLQDMGGFARVQTLTGFVTAANLTGSTSLFTENGDIEYTAAVQPQDDLKLETIAGNIRCRLSKNLNIRGWLRAGSRITWGDEVASNSGALERRLGDGGPLLLATSQAGRVGVEFQDGPSLQVQSSREDSSAIDAREDPASPSPSTSAQEEKTPEVAPPGRAGGTASNLPNEPPPPRSVPVSATTPGDPGDYSLKVNVNLVNVNASVRDPRTNRAVANLNEADFEIYEDGRSQTIAKFDSTEAPFSLLLLLDVSGSTKSYLSLIENASIEFTQQIKPGDRIGLATFNSRTQLRQPFTDDRRAVERAIRGIRSGGGTAFYDALSESVTRYFDGVEGRKAVVVFTDGVDNQLTGDYSNGSSISFPDLYRQIKERDILIYTIFLDTEGRMSQFPGGTQGSLGGILGDIILGRGRGPIMRSPGNGDPRAYEEARQELEQIAGQTGGRMYAPRSIQDLAGTYGEIASDLRVQYTLGYYSNRALNDGRWRDIRVVVRNRPDLIIRHRRGYYGGRD